VGAPVGGDRVVGEEDDVAGETGRDHVLGADVHRAGVRLGLHHVEDRVAVPDRAGLSHLTKVLVQQQLCSGTVAADRAREQRALAVLDDGEVVVGRHLGQVSWPS